MTAPQATGFTFKQSGEENACLSRNEMAITISDGSCRMCIAPRKPNGARTHCITEEFFANTGINYDHAWQPPVEPTRLMAIDHEENMDNVEINQTEEL